MWHLFYRTCGSESDCCSHRGDGKVAKDERDVRDYETIDHKMLKQWEEKKAKFPAGIYTPRTT